MLQTATYRISPSAAAAARPRITVIKCRLWNLTRSGGIVLSSDGPGRAMLPYLSVHFRVRRIQATNNAIYNVSSKVYCDVIALYLSFHDIYIVLKTAKNPYSAHEPPAPDAAFFEPRLDCRFQRFAFSSFRSRLALAFMRPLITYIYRRDSCFWIQTANIALN